ncbi:head decoration protein [Aurantimonas sp. 22II-16-19i]|uniref:head decoration protein n=1 Tax=Aurantimonas sp. 22II-16-19i TaxID=1317114 RepID=UPI0009F7B848|nr:head decoration protein [Aurantimonas sp. 22II-16-19i]ORE87732.1 hypothetical protein ATO4_25298 [Aurantimonas sp. 22II-16-19i]
MVTLTDTRQATAHYLVSEANGMYRSREKVTIASGAGVLKAATVLGKVTASGKYVQFDQDGADGSQTAAGILWEGCDATSADVERVITARDSEVVAEQLIWPDDIIDAERNAALAQLAALGIIAR